MSKIVLYCHNFLYQNQAFGEVPNPISILALSIENYGSQILRLKK